MSTKKASYFLGLLTLSIAGTAVIAFAATAGDITGTIKVAGVRDSANVVVFLEGNGLKAAPLPKHAVMDQQNLAFTPHVLSVPKGTAVDFPNSDKVRHNVYSAAEGAKRLNLGTYPAGVTKTEEFGEIGVVPLLCNVHSDMSGFILVVDTPYFATTDKYGRFSIKGVPAGKYTLRAWHEKVKSAEREITVAAGGPTQVEIEMAGRK